MGRRVARKEEKKKNRKLRLKITGGVLLVLCIAYIISCAVVPADTILKGVSMNGVDLGGLTEKQAGLELTQQYEKDYVNRSLTMKALDTDYRIPMYSSLSFDDAQAAYKAFNYGHDNFFLRGFQLLKALAFGEKMHYYPAITNQAALDGELDKSGLSTLNTTVQTSYDLKEDELEAADYYGKSITAKTPTVVMRPRENYYFGVDFNNMAPCSITYELTAPSSGEVTMDGVYTAPAKEGVYEIRIYCSDLPMVCTYAYAIVKSTATSDDAGSIEEQEKEPIVKIPDINL